MLYAIYLPDGRIHQANKVYDPDGLKYDKQLNNLDYRFVKTNSAGLLPPDQWYVNVKTEQLKKRPIMKNIMINKTRIKCDDKDECIATGIKKGTRIYVMMLDGTMITEMIAEDQVLAITIPTPCTFRVMLEMWPYQNFTYDIEAVPNP